MACQGEPGGCVAEETEQDTGAEASGAGVDPAAVALALNGASRSEADIFLKKQGALIDDQRHHLHEQFKQLRLNIWQQRLGVLLRVATAFVGVGIAAFLGGVLWNAAHADGLVIDSFSVPADLAARGLTGQAIAGQLSDKLVALQNATSTSRAARSYSNDWGNDIKVEIPETGISVSEAYRILKSSLGHETHVSGDVWRTPGGIAIATRVSDGGNNTVSGAETDLAGLIQKAAEATYSLTQPYRYTYYLANLGRNDEAIPRFKSLAATGDKSDRGWAYVGWSNALADSGSMAERENLLKQALPYGVLTAIGNLGIMENSLGRPEQALVYFRKADALTSGGDVNPKTVPLLKQSNAAAEAAILGDFQTAAREYSAAMEGGLRTTGSPSDAMARYQIRDHDMAGARKTLENTAPTFSIAPGGLLLARLSVDMFRAQEAGDWETVLADAQAMNPVFQKYPGQMSSKPTVYDPPVAIAEARLGKFADAERRISPTPADCYPCLLARARIAAIQGQNARADWWFDRAVKSNPSIPIAYSEWGQALLERGQPDAAVEKFKLANQKGPHFADPLEGWGEALMKMNRSELALAKFEEAEKYAPNWGRLHLKWGEALGYSGRKDEAQKQYALAASLDLSNPDKAELARTTSKQKS
jgi:tetratricopeptide (TPR) repeat protein